MYSFSDDQATLQMIDYIDQKYKIKHYVMLYVTFALLSFFICYCLLCALLLIYVFIAIHCTAS